MAIEAVVLEDDTKWWLVISEALKQVQPDGVQSRRAKSPVEAEDLLQNPAVKIITVDLDLGLESDPSDGMDLLGRLNSLRLDDPPILRPDVVPIIITANDPDWQKRFLEKKKKSLFDKRIVEIIQKVGPNGVIWKNAFDGADTAKAASKLAAHFKKIGLVAEVVKRGPEFVGEMNGQFYGFTFCVDSVEFEYELIRSRKKGVKVLTARGKFGSTQFTHNETKTKAMLLLLKESLRGRGVTNEQLQMHLANIADSYNDFGELFKGDVLWQEFITRPENGGKAYYCRPFLPV